MLNKIRNMSKIKIAFLLICTAFLFLGNLISLNIFDLNVKIEHKWIIIFLFSIIQYLFIKNIDSDFNKTITRDKLDKFKLSSLFPKNIDFNFKQMVSRNKGKLKFVFLWEIFILSVFISKAIHGNFLLLEYILYSLIIPVVFFNKKILSYKKLFLISSIISAIPLLYVLSPSNTLGIILCLTGINFINLLMIYDAKDIYICILLIIFNIVIFITKSRTSFISFLVVSILAFFILFKKGNSFIKNILLILLLLSLIYFSYDNVYNLIFAKRINTPQRILAGREKMWFGTLKTGIRMFGNGEEYFMRFYDIGDAHNMFIQVLGAYGIFSCIILVIIYMYIFVKLFNISHKVEYISFFLGFSFLNIAENLFFINSKIILGNILFFMYLGCLINEE